MPGFHHSVAVLPLPFRRSHYVNFVRIAYCKRRKNYVAYVKNAVAVATCRSVAIGSNPIFSVLP